MRLFPLIAFDLIENSTASAKLHEWGHWLGGCNRPFGVQSFGLFFMEKLISVAVSASTVNKHCGGYDRQAVIELARLCSDPDYKWATRPCLRFWREVAPQVWPHWKAVAVVSYANALRHKGDIYRFDGWRKVADVPGGIAGGGWSRGKAYDPKSVWVFIIEPATSCAHIAPAYRDAAGQNPE